MKRYSGPTINVEGSATGPDKTGVDVGGGTKQYKIVHPSSHGQVQFSTKQYNGRWTGPTDPEHCHGDRVDSRYPSLFRSESHSENTTCCNIPTEKRVTAGSDR